MARSERGGLWRGLMLTLLGLGCLGLLGAVAVLMSDLNQRRYRLTVHGGQLYVERGLRLPRGFASYQPDDAALRAIYAPIPLPPHADGLADMGPFDDRADVDRALFAALSQWASERLKDDDPAAQLTAAGLVKRLESLPALSEQQRAELRVLRSKFAWQNGVRLLAEATALLRQGQEEFRLAAGVGGARGAEAQHWVDEVERRIQMYREVAPPPVPGRPSQ